MVVDALVRSTRPRAGRVFRLRLFFRAMPTSTPAPPAETAAPYVLGTDAAEAARLGLQHQLWSAAAHELWERAGVCSGSTVLDLGCGPGFGSLDLAQMVAPHGKVIAIDASPHFLRQLNEQARPRQWPIDSVLGDVQELDRSLAGVPHASVDVAYARWLLCFVPSPGAVIAGAARLLKPGGRLAVQDYFNYERSIVLAPRRDEFETVIGAIGRSWRERGGDPDIAGTLPALMRSSGLRVTHMNVRQRIARPGEPLWAWPDTFFANYIPRLEESGTITPGQRLAFEAAWANAAQDPDSFVLLPSVVEIVAVKEA